MNQGKQLFLLTILHIFCQLTNSQTFIASSIVEDQNQFFRSGTISLVLSPLTVGLNETTTTVVYGGNLFSTSYQLLTSITSLQQNVDINTRTIGVNITTISLTITGFKVKFSSLVILNTGLVKLSYLTIDKNIRDLQFYVLDNYLGVSQPGVLNAVSISNSYMYNFTSKIARSLIAWTTYRIEPFFRGYEITNQNTPEFSLKLSASIVNTSFYQVTLTSLALTDQNVNNVYVSSIIYNDTVLQSQVTLFEKFQVTFTSALQFSNSFGTYKINESNFFVGVQAFTFTDPTSQFSFDIVNDFINQNVSIVAQFPSLDSLGVLIIKVERRSCGNPLYPYFMNGNYRCYEYCPVKYWQDLMLMKCQGCLYDCYTCENYTSCTSCNTTYYKRQDNITNGLLRCKPIFGYYSNKYNDWTAAKCDLNCVQCWYTATNCTTCKSTEYLAITNYTGSCSPCLQHCTSCSDGITCLTCQTLYMLDVNSVCVPNCTIHCASCHIVSSPVYVSVCDVCQFGFQLNQSLTSQCYNDCGNGIWISQFEECDDNNTINGDGCNSQCKLELEYKCYLIDVNNKSLPQVCYYQEQVRFSLRKIVKIDNSNIFHFNLSVSTLNNAVLKQLNWSKIISIDLEYVQFNIVSKQQTYQDQYQTLIDKLVLTFEVQYTENIKNYVQVHLDPKRNYLPQTSATNKQLQLNKTTYLPSRLLAINTYKFSTTPATTETFPLRSQNGLAIIYHSDTLFSISKVISYSLLIISILTLLLLLPSFTVYGGKIIVLQYIFVLNSAYFSLVGFQNIQVFSTIKALSTLSAISMNLNTPTYDSTNPLWWTGITNSFITNSILSICILIIPILISIISRVVLRFSNNKETINKMNFLKKYSLGQLLMTFYLIAAYTFTVNLILSIQTILKKTSFDFSGVAIGSILLIVGIISNILLIKKKQFFWQFINTFFKANISEKYMNLATIVIWINSIALVVLSDIPYGNAVPITLSIIWLGFLLKVKPYIKQNQRKRPIIMQLFNILIQLKFLVLKIKLSQNDQIYKVPTFFHYLPLSIPILLFFAFIYTLYSLVQKIKQTYTNRKEFLQNQKFVNSLSKKTTQTQDQTEQKTIDMEQQIVDQMKSQKKFGFFQLSLSLDREEIDKKWQNLQKLQQPNFKRQQMRQIRKEIKMSSFLQGNNLKQYFKAKINIDVEQNGLKYEAEIGKTQRSAQSQLQRQPQNSHLEKVNCGQKTSTYSNKNQVIQYTYEKEKYKEEWAQFFKPKQITQEQKKHSLAIFDMI